MMASPFIVKEHVVPGQYVREYARATSSAQEDVLELAVKEYVPRETGGEGDVTIIAAHANGFPKVGSLRSCFLALLSPCSVLCGGMRYTVMALLLWRTGGYLWRGMGRMGNLGAKADSGIGTV